jgi:hypothetical protein
MRAPPFAAPEQQIALLRRVHRGKSHVDGSGPVATTAYLVVTEGVSSPLDRADGSILKHPEAKPIIQAQSEFFVL